MPPQHAREAALDRRDLEPSELDRDVPAAAESSTVQLSRVVRQLHDDLERIALTDPDEARELREAAPEALARLRGRACDAKGIALAEYLGELQRDPDMAALEASALQVGLVDAPDPGPYEELSSRDAPASWAVAPDADELRDKFSPRAPRP
jgi:hypothetical protein